MEESVRHLYSASYDYLTASQRYYDDDDVRSSVHESNETKCVQRKPNPQDKANFLSKLTFWWLNWIIFTGYKRPLEDKDLWALRRSNQASYIVPRLKKIWNKQQTNSKQLNRSKETRASGIKRTDDGCKETDRLLDDQGGQENRYTENSSPRTKEKKQEHKRKQEKKPSLVKTLWRGLFGKDFALAVFYDLLSTVIMFVQPQLLKLLIGYTEGKSDWFGDWNEWKGYVYCGAMFVTANVVSLATSQRAQIMITIGMRMQTALTGLVYEKALALSSKSRGTSTAGELVNLMSVDTMRVTIVFYFIGVLWTGPLQIGACLFFLYTTMGVSVLAGLGVMLLVIPLNMLCVSRIVALQAKMMTQKDERMKITTEALSAMKVLKLYAWEESFMKKIKQIRNKETKSLRNLYVWAAAIQVLFQSAPTLVAVTTFAIYIFTGHNLTPSKAFVSLALFDLLKVPLVAIPDCIVGCIRARVSLKRLQQFLERDELDPENVQKRKMRLSCAVKINNGSFTWSNDDAPLMREISLNISTGSLVAIVGQVGCGKSTLLSAILGETDKLQGNVFIEGSVAYVAQQAWIENATVKENILFRGPFDSSRYQQVIEACALRPDLEILPAGDLTEIGERGINLSGGQKQRVSLARAVYFDADIYLLDDPLSAVDAQVGKHIFDNIVGPKGLLRNKTRLLVTHGIHFLPQVDQIVVIKDGTISECGTYSELLANSGAFAEFLQTYASENNSDSSSDKLTRPSKRDLMKSSTSSDATEIKDGDEKTGKIIDEERSETGRVKFSVFLSYLKSFGLCAAVFTILFLLLTEACGVGSGVWLASWSTANITSPKQRDFYIGIYGGIGLGQGLFFLLATVAASLGAIRASRSLHNRLLENIMRSPMSFFDTTPLGRIVNRFSKDIAVIDDNLKFVIQFFFRSIIGLVGTIVAISYATPLILTVLPFLGALYYYIQRVYVASSRELRRIESVSRSPIYSHYLETIHGATTIRAFSQQCRFIRDNYDRTDKANVAFYLSMSIRNWLSVRIEFIGSCLTFLAGFFAVLAKDKITSGLVGMSLTFSLQISETLNTMVRSVSMLETDLVAVERVKEFTETSTEDVWIKPDSRPPHDWPDGGSIVIQDFDLRYREGLPIVLKQINCGIKPGEKIGVVGRTGAGKSSLALALFRILESAGGRILIDGVDIAQIGLHDLRSRLTIMPQDPVLFSGTLRLNLDPFDKHTDQELWRALEVSHLKNFVSELIGGLQHTVAEAGENLSIGQRQLVCLTRALLRKSKVLVLDEATAAVDLETDRLIQQTIRREFADRTVFTIAHRLNTIMDYDRILVLDNGAVVEFDSPANLLKLNGVFTKMARDASLG